MFRRLGKKVPEETNHILTSLAERRDLNRQHVKPEEEIFSKAAVSRHVFEITVRRGDNPNIYFASFIRPHWLNGPLL